MSEAVKLPQPDSFRICFNAKRHVFNLCGNFFFLLLRSRFKRDFLLLLDANDITACVNEFFRHANFFDNFTDAIEYAKCEASLMFFAECEFAEIFDADRKKRHRKDVSFRRVSFEQCKILHRDPK